jgi:inactivated superfamily I helicase
MRVFNVPASVPFLRCIIAALVDGRLIEGFVPRNNPERLAEATLVLRHGVPGGWRARFSSTCWASMR